DDHCLYGLRHAEWPSDRRSSITPKRRRRCIVLACPPHYVRRWSRDDHRSGDIGGRAHARRLSGDRNCCVSDRRSSYVCGSASCYWGGLAIVTRFMGLIVAAMGMQFVLTGLKAFLST